MPPVRKQTALEAEEWMSVEQALNALGDSRPKVLNLVIAGVLTGKHIAGRTVVTRASVDAEIERRKVIAAAAGRDVLGAE